MACFQDPSTRRRPFSAGTAVKNAAKEPTERDGMPVDGPRRTGATGTACSPMKGSLGEIKAAFRHGLYKAFEHFERRRVSRFFVTIQYLDTGAVVLPHEATSLCAFENLTHRGRNCNSIRATFPPST
jgi:hypothetical protein